MRNLNLVTFDDSNKHLAASYIDLVEKNYTHEFFPGLPQHYLKEKRQDFVICLLENYQKDDEEMIAITYGYSLWGWIYIHTLWVQENYKSEGIGSDLIKEVEELAASRKCHGIHLNTSTKKNVEFYTKNGFQIHGTLEDYPLGHCQYYLSKRLA